MCINEKMIDNRRSCSGRVWLQRNVWLVAASALLVIYCIFVAYTNIWAQTFSALNESKHITRTDNVIKEAMRNDTTQGGISELVEEAGEDLKDQLEAKRIRNARKTVMTGLYFRTEGKDTVAYKDEIPLEDAGAIPMVGMTAERENVNAPALHPTAIDDLPQAKTSLERESEATENKEPALSSISVIKMAKDSDVSWTGTVELPLDKGEVVHYRASEPDAITTTAESTQPPQSNIKIRFDKARLAVETPERSTTWVPSETRHHTIIGYNATLAFLEYYTKPADSTEQLFLFFTCSTREGDQDDWNPNCATAREKVYALFAKSPSVNHLVTIYAGPHEDWMGGNKFTSDDDLHLKAIPTLLRWDGGAPGARRSTWGTLVDMSILYDPLVRYLFRNADEQDNRLAEPQVETKEIVTLRGYKPYRAFVESYANTSSSYPLFIMILSGRWKHNNRLWCPWCRQSELPVEYAFYAYAPANAKLVLVETYDNRSEWRNPANDFKLDPQLAIKGVPWFYRVYPGPSLTFEHVQKNFYRLEALQQVFHNFG